MTDTFDPDDQFEPFEPETFEPVSSEPETFDPFEDLEDLTRDDPVPQAEEPVVIAAPPPRSPLLTGLIVLLLLVVLSIAAFRFLSDDDTQAPAASSTTTSLEAGSVTTSTSGAETTTTPAPDTTTVGGVTFEPYVATGAAIPVSELKLAVDAIGPIQLGEPAADAVGQLIASLGDPDEDSGPVTSTGAFGSCEGDAERIVRFGALVAVVVVDPGGDETFGGYRLDLGYGGLSSDAVNLETLSGLKAGSSIAALERIYDRFDVKILADAELGDIFELRNSSGALLLWGPVTSPEADGYVRGIYSPDACGRFG